MSMNTMFWVMFQVVSTAMMVKWYTTKHPAEAMEMYMRWKGMFSK